MKSWDEADTNFTKNTIHILSQAHCWKNYLYFACAIACLCQIRHTPVIPDNDKPLVWIKGEVKSPPFSADARIKAGFLLRRLQKGDMIEMPDSRPMPSIGKNCHELRVNDKNKTWRIIYFIDEDAIVILEVFAKKTQKTPQEIIEISKKRLSRYKQ